MEQSIIQQAIVPTATGSLAALILIWTGSMLTIYKNRTLGYVSKREKLSRHNKEKYLSSHDISSCKICEEEFLCKHDIQPPCECFREYLCDYHALPKGGA